MDNWNITLHLMIHKKLSICLVRISRSVTPESIDNELHADTIRTIATIREIQGHYGESSCHRYIISQCSSYLNVIELLALFRYSGWDKNGIHVDIIPLFETIDDLVRAPEIMRALYETPYYQGAPQQET
jgi:phosphoenolpyruvate carboxylase